MVIQPDKIKHFRAGAIASAFIYALTGDSALAITASVALGIGKEAYDAQGHGTVEVLDAVATVVGGIVGTVIIKAVIAWTSV